MDNDFWGSLRDSFNGFWNNDSVRGFAGDLAGGLAAGGINRLFQGSSGSKGLDTRTKEGTAAEGLKLGAAGGAAKQFQLANQGVLDPREDYLVRKGSRSADAAAGSLETGGHSVRENNSVADRVNENRRLYGGLTSNLTSGYQNRTPYGFSNPSPWAAALSGPVERGFRNLVGGNKWKTQGRNKEELNLDWHPDSDLFTESR